jgi:hypothetical protein
MPDTKIGGMEGGDLGLTPAGTEESWVQDAAGTTDYFWPVSTAGAVYRRRGLITESTTTRTLAAADDGQLIRCTNASGCTITIPLNATVALPIGFRCHIRQTVAGPAGLVSLSAAGPPTLNLPTSIRPPRFMGAQAKKAANETSANYSTAAAIPFDGTDVQDTDDFHNPSTNNARMTIPSGLGIKKVQLVGSIRAGSMTASEYTSAYIYKNGAAFDGGASDSSDAIQGNWSYHNVGAQAICTDSDYFTFVFETESDTSITLFASNGNFILEVIEIDAQGTSAGKDTEFWIEKVATDEWDIGGMFM